MVVDQPPMEVEQEVTTVLQATAQEALQNVSEPVQEEALERVAGGTEDNTTAAGDDVEEKDVNIIAVHADTLISDSMVAKKSSEEACSLFRRLTAALEMETNHELAEEDNGGGTDLIASALGETSEHDALEKRVKRAQEACTQLKKKEVALEVPASENNTVVPVLNASSASLYPRRTNATTL